MKKTYVLDTSVLIQNPDALFQFEDNNVIIADATINELDKLKEEKTERGYNARKVVRHLKKLREKGNLSEGVQLDNGGNLKIELNCIDTEMPVQWNNSNDNRILKVCKGHQKKEAAILVTQDDIMAIKADMLNVEAQSYISEQVSEYSRQYTGRLSVFCNDDEFDKLYQLKKTKDKELNLDWIKKNLFVYGNEELTYLNEKDLVVNEFLVISRASNPKDIYLCRFDGKGLKPLKYENKRPYGVTPRNIGQKLFQEALMTSAEEAPLVICKGPSGTAKTFYSLAVGLSKMIDCSSDEKEYRKILVCRPNVKMDDDIGFLPGDEQEKIAPLLRPVMDNLEVLSDFDTANNEKDKMSLETLMQLSRMTFESIAYMRGRSIAKNWIIIDEAQNLTPNQAKGIITRAGMGAKIIFIGDPEQIDADYLDERTNGLSYASDKMKGSKICWQISMTNDECERSPLAQEASERM